MASPPTFYADDKFFDVVQCLEARGWKRAPVQSNVSNAATLALRWRNLSSLVHERFFVRCGRSTFVNHFEGAQCLSNKGSLTALLAGLDNGRGAPCYPRCHALPGLSPPSSEDAATGKSANAETKLVAALTSTMRDVGTQLAVGALREVFGDPSFQAEGPFTGAAFASPAKSAELGKINLDLDLLSLCMGIAERWAEQLEKSLSLPSTATPTGSGKSVSSSGRSSNRYTSSRSSKPSAPGSIKSRGVSRAPSKAVLDVGTQEWAALIAPGGTVQALARALRGQHSSNHETSGHVDNEPVSSKSISNRTIPGTSRRSAVVKAAIAVLRRLSALDIHFGLGGSGVWIVKPSGLSCGRGILCVNSVAGVAAAIAGLDYKAVVQKCATR